MVLSEINKHIYVAYVMYVGHSHMYIQRVHRNMTQYTKISSYSSIGNCNDELSIIATVLYLAIILHEDRKKFQDYYCDKKMKIIS